MASPANRHCANCIGTLSFPNDSHGMTSYQCSLLAVGVDGTVVELQAVGVSRPYAKKKKNATKYPRSRCRYTSDAATIGRVRVLDSVPSWHTVFRRVDTPEFLYNAVRYCRYILDSFCAKTSSIRSTSDACTETLRHTVYLKTAH